MSGIFIYIFRIFLTEIPLSKQRSLRCLPRSFFVYARHKWVKRYGILLNMYNMLCGK